MKVKMIIDVPAGDYCWKFSNPAGKICRYFDNEFAPKCELGFFGLEETGAGFKKSPDCLALPKVDEND